MNERVKKRLSFVFVIFTLLVLLLWIIIPRMGSFLIVKDKPVKADALIILMGNIPDRTLEAFDLYKQGYARKIIIVMANRYGIDYFRKKGIPLDGQTTITKKALEGLGVSSDDIIILPGDAKSTQEEAEALKKYVALHKQVDTVLLVSSSYHTRRAKLIFNNEMKRSGEKVTIVSCPSKYTGFNDKQWWKDRESSKIVFFEYLKIFNVLLF